MIKLKSDIELAYMQDAGRLVAETLQEIKAWIKPGISTGELDAMAEKFILDRGGIPAFKGLRGYPANVCISLNEEVVHGIPGKRVIKNGDIVSLDLGVILYGYCGDAAVTVAVGEVGPEIKKLIDVTEQSLYKGIEKAVIGNKLGDISHAVQCWAEKHGYGVVRCLVGHGIGRELHEEPQIPNFGLPGRGPELKNGMTLAIEPMLNIGTYKVRTLRDNWTVVTADRKWSAHFEHTVAITERGPQIFTKL